jgi:hypothetical protein
MSQDTRHTRTDTTQESNDAHALVDAAVGVQLYARAVALAVDPVATVPSNQHKKLESAAQ